MSAFFLDTLRDLASNDLLGPKTSFTRQLYVERDLPQNLIRFR